MFDMLEKIVQQYNSQHKDNGGQIVINRYCSECSEPEVELNSDQETPLKKRKLAYKKKKRDIIKSSYLYTFISKSLQECSSV